MSYLLRDYDSLIALLTHRKLTSVADFLLSDLPTQKKSVILRHDVDRLAWRAVAMARLETARGVRSTYYFRCTPNGQFPWQAIATIHALGHEVGYHYECLSSSNGDRAAALKQFSVNLIALRRIVPCQTVAMHGAPLSIHSNQDLLVGCDLADFELVGDASLSFASRPLAYFTDTGGRWNAGNGLNFRDRVGLETAQICAPDEPEFAAWVADFAKPIYISTHPERWPTTVGGFAQAWLTDVAANLAKRVLHTSRRRRSDAHHR